MQRVPGELVAVEGLDRVERERNSLQAQHDALYLAVKEEVAGARRQGRLWVSTHDLTAILKAAGEKREVPDYGELVAALRHAQEVVGAESVSVDEEVRLLAHIGEVLERFSSEKKGAGQ